MKHAVKRIMVLLLAAALLIPVALPEPAHAETRLRDSVSTREFQSQSVSAIDISSGTMTVKTTTYKHKTWQDAQVTVKVNGKTLREGFDYIITKNAAHKHAGLYTVKVRGIGSYKGTLSAPWRIKKSSSRKITITGNKSVKASKLKKKSVTRKLRVKREGIGEITYKSSNKKVKITPSDSGRTAKVTLKKGLKKGKYKITITVGSTKNFTKDVRTIYIRVK